MQRDNFVYNRELPNSKLLGLPLLAGTRCFGPAKIAVAAVAAIDINDWEFWLKLTNFV